MCDCWLDVDTVPTDAAVTRGLNGFLRNDCTTYPGLTLLCWWWLCIDAGADTEDCVVWMLTCRSIVYLRPVKAEFLSDHLPAKWGRL